MIFAWLLFIGLCSKYWWISATTTVKRGDMNLVILKVVSSLLVRVNPYTANQRECALGDDTVEELYEYKNVGVLKIYCSSFASKARQVWFSHPMLTIVKQTHWSMSSSGGRLVCPPSSLVLSYLRLLSVCCLSLNAVSPGFLKNFFTCKIPPPPVHSYLGWLIWTLSWESFCFWVVLLLSLKWHLQWGTCWDAELRVCMIKMSNRLVFCRVSAKR